MQISHLILCSPTSAGLEHEPADMTNSCGGASEAAGGRKLQQTFLGFDLMNEFLKICWETHNDEEKACRTAVSERVP